MKLIAQPSTVKRFIADYPLNDRILSLSFRSSGDVDSLNIEDLSLGLGESSFTGIGYLIQPLEKNKIRYNAELYNILISQDELQLLSDYLTEEQIAFLSEAQYSVDLRGTSEELFSDLNISSKKGSLQAQGQLGFNESLPLQASVELDSLNLGSLVSEWLVTSDLNGTVQLTTSSLKDIRFAEGFTKVDLNSSLINGVEFDTIQVSSDFSNGLFSPSYSLVSPTTNLKGRGSVNVQDSIPVVQFTGRGDNIDLKSLTQINEMAEAFVDVEYEVSLSGTDRT